MLMSGERQKRICGDAEADGEWGVLTLRPLRTETVVVKGVCVGGGGGVYGCVCVASPNDSR